MGMVKTPSGTQISMEELDGEVTFQDIYDDLKNEHYSATYRISMAVACGKLGRQAWGALPTLREVAKCQNPKLVKAAEDALRKIDPGRPTIGEGFGPHPENLATPGNFRPPTQPPPANTFQTQTANGLVNRKLEVKKVVITDLGDNLNEGTRSLGFCNFCGKDVAVTTNLLRCCGRIAGPDADGGGRLFCNFCLRNSHYKPRLARNLLILTLRGVIGYYYYCFNAVPKQPTMFPEELRSYIELHIRFGTQNPLFRYDPDTFCWFVDFGKVGVGKRRMPVESVLETVVQLLASFNLYENVRDSSPAKLFEKYKDSILEFHHHRRRPPEFKILCPTLYGCGIPGDSMSERAIPVDVLRNFLPHHMENFNKRR